MVIGGVIYKVLWLNKKSFWLMVIYVIMGWMCLFVIILFYYVLGLVGFGLFLVGGIIFMLGVVLYSFFI